jgi:hypothetical protein
MARSTRAHKDGVSLAKGPVGLLGLAMLAFGVLSFLLGDNSLTSSPVDGDVDGDTFLGVEGNGWTNLLWIAGGALLAFGAPFHWGAKSMALIVGLALGAASVIAMVDGETIFQDGDVLGIFAANNWTIALWGLASAYLLVSSLLPKVGRKREHHEHRDTRDRTVVEHADREPAYGSERVHDREVVAPASDHDRIAETDRTVVREEPVLGRDAADRDLGRSGSGRFGREREPLVDPQVEASRDAEGRRR